MEKKIEYYLHLYLGCRASVLYMKGTSKAQTRIGTIVGITTGKTNAGNVLILFDNNTFCDFPVEEINLLLRPLSSMTEEERKELDKIRGENADTVMIPAPVFGLIHEFVPMVFHFLLSKHFDLFGLIEAGLAIDSNSLTSSTQEVKPS